MLIRTFVEPPLDNNNYVVIDGDEAVLIDCSTADPAITAFIRDNGARLKYILLTHGHFDHILGLADLRQREMVPVAVHPADRLLMADVGAWTERILNQSVQSPVTADMDLTDGQILSVGQESVRVIATPGHTPGGVSFLIGNNLFSGDTLFRGGCGRTDLPGSNPARMKASLKRLFELAPETIVYPGHGPTTTIGAEKIRY